MYICNGSQLLNCDVKCEHLKVHESVNCCNEQSRFCGKIRSVVKCEYVKEIIHMACLGLLCEKLGESKIVSPKSTMRLRDVTCPKCIEILKKHGY